MPNDFLSQDIWDLDILGGEPTPQETQAGDLTDMFTSMPEREQEVATEDSVTETQTETPMEGEAMEEMVEEVSEDTTAPEWDQDLEALLQSLSSEQEGSQENIDDASETVSNAAEKIETLQAQEEDPDISTILNEVYEELIRTDNALQEANIKAAAKDGIIKDLQTRIADMEIDSYGNTYSNDPDVMILNKMFDAATTGSDTAKNKIRDVMDKMYTKLFDESYEESKVNNNINNSSEVGPTFNETTLAPEIPEMQEPEFDVNSPTSILGY